ncbi:hypothetical protein ACOMHN_022409 [Nucella lapillus]
MKVTAQRPRGEEEERFATPLREEHAAQWTSYTLIKAQNTWSVDGVRTDRRIRSEALGRGEKGGWFWISLGSDSPGTDRQDLIKTGLQVKAESEACRSDVEAVIQLNGDTRSL